MATMKEFASDNGEKMWIELTNKESDWRECFKVVQRSFHEDPLYRLTHPDPEKRQKFLSAYLDWLYECIFKDDRGVLVVIKCQDEEGNVKIIGGAANTVDEDTDVSNDASSLAAVDAEGWNRLCQRDEWEWSTYFPKLQKAAKHLGTTIMHGVFQSVDDGYRGRGIGTKFVMEAVRMMCDEIVRRKRRAGIQDPKPPLAYCVCDHARARNFTKKCGFVEVGEFTNISRTVNGDIETLWVFLYSPENPSWVDLVRKELGYCETSKL